MLTAGVLSLALLSGCATTGDLSDDPLEGYNRAMFGFNEKVDQWVMVPVAQGYDAIAPQPVQTGIGNFFGNLGDLWIGANNLLQGKVTDGLSDAGRFLINSTVGILGLFDVATEAGLEKHDEDFGQTLGKWGVGEGPFFVVPILGPSTVRDALALAVDFRGDPVGRLGDVASRNSLRGLRLVQSRAMLLGVEKTLDEAALDKYLYSRDYYLQQRRYRVFDGRPPRLRDDELSLLSVDGPVVATALAALKRLDLAFLFDNP